MAGKNLYEILEVAPNATPEMMLAAYNLQSERLKVRASRDPQTAATLRTAVEEAYRTLSDPHAKARYDLKLRQSVVITPVMTIDDDRSWFARNWVWLAFLALVIGGGGYFYDKNKNQRIAAERKLAEQKAALEQERAERAAEEAARQAAAAEVQAQRERAREIAWTEQVRAEARVNMARRVQAEERDRQLTQRQKLMEDRKEEAERLRQENEARRNLEREKARLRQLECARGPC
jgi:hypothetical protein